MQERRLQWQISFKISVAGGMRHMKLVAHGWMGGSKGAPLGGRARKCRIGALYPSLNTPFALQQTPSPAASLPRRAP